MGKKIVGVVPFRDWRLSRKSWVVTGEGSQMFKKTWSNVQSNWDSKIVSVVCRHDRCLDLLISHGAGVDMQDGQWNTPLILTCFYAHPAEAAMRSLIKAGCDVNIVGWFLFQLETLFVFGRIQNHEN